VEQKIFYREVNSIRKGFKSQILLIRDKAGNTVNNKEKVLHWWSEYRENHFKLEDGTDKTVGKIV
jgi:hypothetical protein